MEKGREKILIVLNEKKLAEYIIENGFIDNKPSRTLRLLAKYYHHVKKLKLKLIEEELHGFMKLYYPNYNSAVWENNIERYSRQAKKSNLREIEKIQITQSELKFINNIDDDKYQRLVFVMLCYCKFYNILSETNSNWVNISVAQIFKSARVNVRYSIDKWKMMYDLREYLNGEFITHTDKKRTHTPKQVMKFTKKCDSHNIQLNAVYDDSEPVLDIADFRELGYEYLLYKGGDFTRCEECNILFRQNKNKTFKYCHKHRGYIPKGTKKITCIEPDCSQEVIVDAKDNKTVRCDECKTIYNREQARIRKQKQRSKK